MRRSPRLGEEEEWMKRAKKKRWDKESEMRKTIGRRKERKRERTRERFCADGGSWREALSNRGEHQPAPPLDGDEQKLFQQRSQQQDCVVAWRKTPLTPSSDGEGEAGAVLLQVLQCKASVPLPDEAQRVLRRSATSAGASASSSASSSAGVSAPVPVQARMQGWPRNAWTQITPQ
jgi:hypothetical protein